MIKLDFLPSILLLISAAVVVVLFFRWLKLSPVLGYFTAGAAIGDNGLKIISSHDTHALAEFGVVFLLFAIGLELTFSRLKAMRKYVFGFGSMQVVFSALLIGFATIYYFKDINMAILVGGGLALSSTAIVLQVIAEARSQSTQVGRLSLAVLLLQDFAVVPLLVTVPLLSDNSADIHTALMFAFVKAMLALFAIFIIGRLLLRPLFGLITSPNMAVSNEIFVAATILIALGSAWATESMGLSLALGAFIAGILVAETEFQLQAEESIAPFKGLLLGLFFMTVGMTIDLKMVYENLYMILFIASALLVTKTVIIAGLGRLFGFSLGVAIHSGLLLSQGGEFAFILFNLGVQNNLLSQESGQILMLVVTLTMALTPLLSIMGSYIAKRLDNKQETSPHDAIMNGARDLNNHVVIAGFGIVGKTVARLLAAENIHYIVLDVNAELVEEGKSQEFPIYRGDVSSLGTLEAAGLDRARSVIIAVDNKATIKKALKNISANYPEVSIVVKTENLSDSAELYELGATLIVPEDYETGLQLGGAVLKSVGVSEFEISRIKNLFRNGNYIMIKDDEEHIEAVLH